MRRRATGTPWGSAVALATAAVWLAAGGVRAAPVIEDSQPPAGARPGAVTGAVRPSAWGPLRADAGQDAAGGAYGESMSAGGALRAAVPDYWEWLVTKEGDGDFFWRSPLGLRSFSAAPVYGFTNLLVMDLLDPGAQLQISRLMDYESTSASNRPEREELDPEAERRERVMPGAKTINLVLGAVIVLLVLMARRR